MIIPMNEADIQNAVAILAQRYGAEKVFLFGSRAAGTATEDSDADFVVVKDTALSFFDRLRDVANVCRWQTALDVLVYTPTEFAEMSRTNGFIRDEVLGKGRLLYDRVG